MKHSLISLAVLCCATMAYGQKGVTVHGSLQSDILFPETDYSIGTETYDDKVLTNTYANVGVFSKYVKALNGNVLEYNVDAPSTLSVYAITGKLAAKYSIANAGTLNVSNLSKGVYVYTTGRLSGKFIVR